MEVIRLGMFAVLVVALSGCESGLEKQARVAVNKGLNDPDSTVFRDVETLDREGLVGVCGSFNTKNRLGGMVGYKRFIFTADPEILQVEPDSGEFQELGFERAWNIQCK